ncbi:MAG: hypothetical protein RMJ19_04310 [Gemmatales bacterium]|nr:hypothetical protein [Gemmatales bacterium]MDW8174871.1 hypothetical protein [Gemmatales bacterium]
MNTDSKLWYVSILSGLVMLSWACGSLAQPPIEKSAEYELFRKLVRDPTILTDKVAAELYDKVEKDPAKYVEVVIRYYCKEKVGELPDYLAFLLAATRFLRPAEAVKSELVKHLELDEQGDLKMDTAAEPHSPGPIAYWLLQYFDKQERLTTEPAHRAEHVPFFRPLNIWLVRGTEQLRGTYPQIVASYGKKVPPALVEFLFQEYGPSACDLFRHFHPEETRLKDHEFHWAAHILETTVCRLENAWEKYAELELARRALYLLADDSAWYHRRMVVHALLRHPRLRRQDLGAPELLKKLQNDPHPLVRDRAKHIKLDNK